MEKKDFVRIDSRLNPSDDKLPFGYYSPQLGGKVKWVCDYDPQNKIVSVFEFEDGPVKDRKIGTHKNLEDAKQTRDALIKDGWLKIKPPEITVKYDDGTSKPLNRDHKRKLQKQLDKMSKDNPF